MAATYQHASDAIPGYPPYSGVIRVADGKFIACAANSQDWQEYLTWAAADPANVPDPFLSPNAGGVAIVPAPDQPVYGSMLESLPPADLALAPPVMRDIPFIEGAAEVGGVLTCTMGNWDSEPPPHAYEYRWLSDAPADLSAGSSYVVAATDAGHTIVCVVTATNVNGSTTAKPSNGIAVPVPVPVPETAVVAAPAPMVPSPPPVVEAAEAPRTVPRAGAKV